MFDTILNYLYKVKLFRGFLSTCTCPILWKRMIRRISNDTQRFRIIEIYRKSTMYQATLCWNYQHIESHFVDDPLSQWIDLRYHLRVSSENPGSIGILVFRGNRDPQSRNRWTYHKFSLSFLCSMECSTKEQWSATLGIQDSTAICKCKVLLAMNFW